MEKIKKTPARNTTHRVAGGKQIKKEKKQTPAEETVSEQEAILASLGDHIMGVVVVDKNGKITRVNKGFETLIGWQEKEVLGKSLVEIMPREDKDKNRVPFKKRILSQILSGKTLTTTTTTTGIVQKTPIFYYIRKDKSRFPATSVISPLMFNKKITGAVEVFYDITREKELEQIRQDFLSLASHQLRTPLSGTKWLIETMHRGIIGEIPKKQKEYLDEIYKINEQMIRLVSDILSALRLESDETLLKKEKISVEALFKDVLMRVSVAAKMRKIELQSPLNHRALIMETDSEILKSILGCFLSNAIDYSRPGQKVIFDVKEESRAVVFSVRDFGIGIPAREQGRLFERFHRASNAKALKPSGTGLGISISKKLAEKLGATISFESEEGKGSTFYLRIPKKLNP